MSQATRPNDRHIIWSNQNLDVDDWREDYKEFIEANELDDDPNDEQALYEWMEETNYDYLSDERVNLNVQLSQPIIVIGDIGRWNGRVMGYKDIPSGNIRDCLYADTDYTEWYVDMLALFNIVQGTISTIMGSAGFSTPQQTVLPPELITSVEECGFFESIPLWAVTLIGGLFITVMSFILIMTVYGRFFKLYMYTALAPIPLSTFAGEPSQNVGKSFIKSYCAVCLEGAVIVLSCIIFSLFASSPPVVNPDEAAVTQVWSYVGELLFNMLVLVGSVKMSDRIIREMMGL